MPNKNNNEEEVQAYSIEMNGRADCFEVDDSEEADPDNCIEAHYRDIYKGGFPNCAATVEDGSWCGKNDACSNNAIKYKGMENCFAADCSKAWK